MNDPCGHSAGSLFGNIEMILKDFGKRYNPTSIRNNWEYATFIYEVKVKWASKTPPYKIYTNIAYSYYKPWTDKSANGVTIKSSYNTNKNTLVGIIHTHAAYDKKYDNENFSPEDKKAAETFKLNMYLITPSGRIKMYDYKKKTVTEYKFETYHDNKTRSGFLFWSHSCPLCVYR